jgi:hypothetical protein
MTKKWIPCCALFVSAPAVMALQLDDPIGNALVRPIPTVRMEIRRGIDTAARCDSDHQSDPDKSVRCMAENVEANRKTMGAGYEAFEAGLAFGEWIHDERLISSAKASDAIPQDMYAANRSSFIAWIAYNAARQKSGLTDDQMIEAGNFAGPIREMLSSAHARFRN